MLLICPSITVADGVMAVIRVVAVALLLLLLLTLLLL